LSAPRRIQRVEAFPLSFARDLAAATGTAGSPSRLADKGTTGAYKWSTTVAAVYGERIESTLVRITCDDGLIGWGEAQAPVAPRVIAVIIEDILAGLLEGESFDGSRAEIERHWTAMYQSMRVRGQTGGFMLDAISGIDLALWDLAGKIHNQPVAKLIRPDARVEVPAYCSGLAGTTLVDRCAFARRHYEDGFRLFKIFFDKSEAELIETLDALRAELGPDTRLAVDALWRLEWPSSRGFIEQLAERNLYWLEAPFMPDEPDPHRELAKRLPELPIALGESYRTQREMRWFLDEGLVRFVQPDLGRSGITESLRIAAMYPNVSVVPHVSIALGPQIASAIHLTAALTNAPVCEFNPTVFETSNRHLAKPLEMRKARYILQQDAAGLGVTPLLL
jgi:galactonate dehydratase